MGLKYLGIKSIKAEKVRFNSNDQAFSKLETDQEFRNLRKKRVFQITIGVMLALMAIGLIHLYKGLVDKFFFLSLGAFLCLFALRELKRDQLDRASKLILAVLVALGFYMASTGGGLRDIVLLSFPAVVIFSTMTTTPKYTLFVLAALLVFILALGLGTELEWWSHSTEPDGLTISFMIMIVLVVISYSIYSLHLDMVNLLQRVQHEKQQNIESQKHSEKLALMDTLTNLPNRRLAKKRFQNLLKVSERHGQKVALMYIDLDEFKIVNDSHGHEAGDKLLIEVSLRLKETLRESDTVCRLGGDEFLILVSQVESEAELGTLAQRVLDSINSPISFADIEHSCSGSLGIAVSHRDGETFEELIKHADMAMYLAKSLGRNNFQYFDKVLQDEADRKLELINAMRLAIDQGEFHLVYQPKIRLKDNTIIGAEALLRWNSEKHGVVTPDELIPLAESSGFIHPLGKWVIEQASKDLKHLKQLGMDHIHFSINVSVAQLQSQSISDHFVKVISDNEFNHGDIDIEITESLLANDQATVSENLKVLKNIGITLSIDDFGTGYSNLGYLKRFEIETLKIDKSFVHDVRVNLNNQAIVRAIIEICHALSITAVAEGVEDQEVADFLRSLNCQYAQGYYWSKPVSIEDFVEFYRSQMAISKGA